MGTTTTIYGTAQYDGIDPTPDRELALGGTLGNLADR